MMEVIKIVQFHLCVASVHLLERTRFVNLFSRFGIAAVQTMCAFVNKFGFLFV